MVGALLQHIRDDKKLVMDDKGGSKDAQYSPTPPGASKPSKGKRMSNIMGMKVRDSHEVLLI